MGWRSDPERCLEARARCTPWQLLRCMKKRVAPFRVLSERHCCHWMQSHPCLSSDTIGAYRTFLESPSFMRPTCTEAVLLECSLARHLSYRTVERVRSHESRKGSKLSLQGTRRVSLCLE